MQNMELFISVCFNSVMLIGLLVHTQMKNKSDKQMMTIIAGHTEDLSKIKKWSDIIADRLTSDDKRLTALEKKPKTKKQKQIK